MSKEVKDLLKTYMKVEKEAQEIKDKQTKLAKRIPDIGPQPPKFTKVKDQVTTLKQKRLLLEKESQKISQEHDYMQKILNHELKKQLAPPQQQNDILQNLEKVAQETQLAYLKFRTEKFLQKISRVFAISKIKREFLQKLKIQHQQQHTSDVHYSEFRNYQLLKKAFNGWIKEHQKLILERKQREEQQVQKYEMGQNQLAVEFRNFCLMNKCFKALQKYVKINSLTKQFETDQNQIKAKVNNFLNEMQKQIITSMEKEREEIEIIKQSHLTAELTISDSQPSIQEEPQDEAQVPVENEFLYQSNEEQLQLTIQPVQQQEIIQRNEIYIEEPDHLPTKQENKQQTIKQEEQQQKKEKQPQPQPPPLPSNPWKQKPSPSLQCMVEDNEQSIQRQNSSKSSSQQNFQRQKSVDRKNAIAQELEEKAKKRKEMNEMIKKKHEDKKKQQQLEKQALEQQKLLDQKKQKEEEYNRIQEKKRKEKEQKEKLEQMQFEMQYKTEIAIRHYEKQLQKYQIFIPIVKLYEEQQYKIEKATRHYENILKSQLINKLKKAQQIQEEQREYEEQIKQNIAYSHFVKNQKIKVFSFLKETRTNSIIKQKDAKKVRNRYLIRNVMTAWYVQMPELVAENLKLEKASQRLVEDFRRAMLQKTYFLEWLNLVKGIKAERIREQNKQEMWSKVNQWLQELDEEK